MKAKIIITLVALFGYATQIFATEPLVVDKLIHKTTDLSASNAPKDMNGNSCGLLKVITNDRSMTFEGSVIGTPEYKNGEYWVYLPQGTYQLKLKSDKNDPLLLSFRDYNIDKVTSKGTYELTFFSFDHEKLSRKYLTVEQGPSPKNFVVQLLSLPYGWTVGGMSTLEYLKRLAKVIDNSEDFNFLNNVCSILADHYTDGSVESYRLIIETSDKEEEAIFGAASYGGFDTKIYKVIP